MPVPRPVLKSAAEIEIERLTLVIEQLNRHTERLKRQIERNKRRQARRHRRLTRERARIERFRRIRANLASLLRDLLRRTQQPSIVSQQH